MKNKKVIILSSFMLLSSSCSMFKSRQPASESNNQFSNIYTDILNSTASINKNSLECKNKFESHYIKLLNIAGSSYFEDAITASLDDQIKDTFSTRIQLKNSFADFNAVDETDHACVASAQEVFKSLRYIEDYLIELRVDKNRLDANELVNLEGQFPLLLVNPKYQDEFKNYNDLKSGDVILSRGNAFSSAAIARIGLNDYQFSHLSFVYRDLETKELFTTEAHIEIGSITAPFKAHLDEKNVRSAVFRFNDEAIAHKASKYMFDRVKKAQETGKYIEYDFSMNFKDDSKLFCSEIISTGFKFAMPNFDYIPKFKSHFSPGIIPFLNDIGVPVNSENVSKLDVFAPGDIQFDPRFELIAEWRNPKKLEESRFKDFILTKLFERMDKAGYKFDSSLKMDAQAKTFWLLRRTPLIKKFLEKKLPLNMTPTQMELFMTLDKIGDALYKYLDKKSLDFDHPMTPIEIYQALDEYIKKDLELYQKYKKGLDVQRPTIHLLFHP